MYIYSIWPLPNITNRGGTNVLIIFLKIKVKHGEVDNAMEEIELENKILRIFLACGFNIRTMKTMYFGNYKTKLNF